MQKFLTIVILITILLCDVALVTSIAQFNRTNTTSSPWFPRAQTGCRTRPWICNLAGGSKELPENHFRRRMCCWNRCVDITSDVYNCGFCWKRCPFTWQCCNGLCVNINVNPFNCGDCGKSCPVGSLCFYGMCGYAIPPIHPKPPFPPEPPKRCPPKPAKLFPPKPPQPMY